MLRTWGWFLLGLVLIVGGSLLASRVQTSGGVRVEDVRFAGDGGLTQSGLLYVPAGATARDPAPAVLASHGYINTREMQSPFAIELARRGFVVLAMDMTGHGYSEGAVGQNDFGGPAALRYLQSLPFVDRANIGLEGHSMGGGPILAAAVAQPDGYRSIVLEGSTPGLLRAKAPENPRNLALVFGQFDEFAQLMWQVPKGSEVARSPRLMKLFGSPAPVVEGRVYGSVADGTARVLYNPPVTHPWEHFSKGGVEPAVAWFQQTLDGEASGPPAGEQIWLWKEIGTGVAFVGFAYLLLGTFEILLRTPLFARLATPGQAAAERRDGRWWLSFALTALIPAATFYPAMKVGQVFFPMRLFPQWIQNQLLVWALVNALIMLGVAALRKRRPVFTTRWLASAALALATVAVGYLSLVVVDAAFKTDYRFWVLGLKPLAGSDWAMLVPYVVLWSLFFLVAIRALVSDLAIRGDGFLAQVVTGKVAMSLGFVLLVAIQYVSLFATGVLATPTEPLNTIVAIQFIPLLALVGAIGMWTWRRTGSYAPGALICALVIGWYITGSTAVHWTPDFQPPPPGASRAR
ncbi:alpha/beta hydrolase [Phenylobacterium sp.]|jgi:pimeloyl-ACP methyl ester carboxylesterase|uniref:alpha/beta hydrolase n=1 Tax=Phenylobacterium sp. TaxID=1871053 RepID=UPI002F92F4EA